MQSSTAGNEKFLCIFFVARRVEIVMHALWTVNKQGLNETCVFQKRREASSLGEDARIALVVGRTDVREWSRYHDESEWSLIISMMRPGCLP